MAVFSSLKAENLRELLLHELGDLYDAEHRLVEALPLLAEAAQNRELTQAFKAHLKETEEHVLRLEEAFRRLEEEPKRETCAGMKGLIEEGNHVLKGSLTGAVKDAALISAAQRVEHYEMAAYGTAHAFALVLDLPQVAEILAKTLAEEKKSDMLLTEISKTVNQKAPTGVTVTA